ncbi:MAG TPA: AAA family ATPase [Gaiellaceae bacterium]|nr:AAA family ATPase [Gaiellaceae bacterium]
MAAANDTAQDSRCPSCGAAAPAGSRFCASCGAPLQEAAPPREERKLVSILFVDLVGFTARSDRADPEDVRETLQLYHAEAKRRIERFGGVLEKFIGDAVMAVFGAPTAHGDDAERAVRAGLSVLEGIERLNRDRGLELAARAAVNTGEAVVSVSATRADALATGDVVNTASRLQSAAPPGRLLAGAETHRATRHAIEYEPLAPVEAKGKGEPVEAWLAVRAAGEFAERGSRDTPLVGRSRELELMGSAWARCLEEQRPHLVTVLGPPGIGKSRLCREFAERVRSDGARVLRGRCLPYAEQVGYQAFARLASAAAGILESDPPAAARTKLSELVRRLLPAGDTDDLSRYLGLLLGLAPDDEAQRAQLLFYAARRFVESLGLEQPTVLVFEDIHWAQPSELALLEYLARHLRDAPVLLVAAARPELLDARPTWGAGLAAQTTIPLDPLRAEEAAELAGRLVRTQGAAPAELAAIVETSGGNPLFLEELAASLAEVETSGGLPVTVREAIAARIDALPAEAREALLGASVVGRTFWRDVLEATGEIGDVDGALAELEARDLVRRDPASELAGDTQFTFRHILIRDVAYATVPRAVRRQRHAAVARYVEETLRTAETLPTILAHHWREAGEPARAIPHLLAAADAARRAWAHETVIELLTATVELAPSDAERRRLRLQRALTLVELEGEDERAAAELEALLPELEGRERLDALIGIGHAYLWTERDEDTLRTAAEAAALRDELGDETATAPVLAMESQALAMRGAEGDLERAFELGEQALRLWVPETRQHDLTQHLHLHADTSYWVGEYERSLDLAHRSRALAGDVRSPDSLLRAGGQEALSLAALGRHEEAIAIWDEMFEVARDIGWRPITLLNYSSLAFREIHDLAEARRRTEEAVELSASLAFSMPRQFARSDLLFTLLLADDVGGAQALWPGFWEGAEEATAWTRWLISGRLAAARAEIALHAEPPDVAAEWAERSLEVARRTRRRKYEARSLTLLGLALHRLGRGADALAPLRAAVDVADALVGPPARWHARAALGEVAYAQGADDVAAEAYGEAADLVEQFAATLAPQRSATLLAAPEVREILKVVGRSPVA